MSIATGLQSSFYNQIPRHTCFQILLPVVGKDQLSIQMIKYFFDKQIDLLLMVLGCKPHRMSWADVLKNSPWNLKENRNDLTELTVAYTREKET